MLPYVGFAKDARQAVEAEAAVRWALSCVQCGDPAPCTAGCPQQADIPAVMRWLGRSGCTGFSRERWLAVCEQVAEQEAASAIADAYND